MDSITRFEGDAVNTINLIEEDSDSDDQEPTRKKSKLDDGIITLSDMKSNFATIDNFQFNTRLRGAQPLHIRKAVTRVLAARPQLSRAVVLDTVQTYCRDHPNERNTAVIVKYSLDTLDQLDEAVDISATEDDLVVIQPTPIGGTDEKEASKNEEVEVVSTSRFSPLGEVLKILPDAKPSFVTNLLNQHNDNVGIVMELMLDKGYEKDVVIEEVKEVIPVVEEKDFTSQSWTTSSQYRIDALNMLNRNFPFLKVSHIEKMFSCHQFHYYPTLVELEKLCEVQAVLVDCHTNSRQERKTKCHSKPFTKTSLQEMQALLKKKKSFLHVNASARDYSTPVKLSDPVAEAELVWLVNKRRRELEQKDEQLADELNEQLATEEGSLIECGCCFSEHPFERMVQCSEGHLFCKNCLKHYAEQTVFGNGRSHLQCMNTTGDPCSGYFPDSMLQLALPPKVWEKYSEALTRDALKAAQLDDLVVCHDCQLQVEMPEEAGNILTCPECHKRTCRLCGEEAHIPLKCSEVEKKKDAHKRLSIEEALTKARVRECPRCKTPFFKTEGCNKMTCRCGLLMCYICRADISKTGYQHFCQVPHCTHKDCKKCRLFTNSEEDDRRAMYEAGLKTLEELQKEELEEEQEEASTAKELSNEPLGKSKNNGEETAVDKNILAKLLDGGIPKKAVQPAQHQQHQQQLQHQQQQLQQQQQQQQAIWQRQRAHMLETIHLQGQQ
eukprot:gene6965-7706_t